MKVYYYENREGADEVLIPHVILMNFFESGELEIDATPTLLRGRNDNFVKKRARDSKKIHIIELDDRYRDRLIDLYLREADDSNDEKDIGSKREKWTIKLFDRIREEYRKKLV